MAVKANSLEHCEGDCDKDEVGTSISSDDSEDLPGKHAFDSILREADDIRGCEEMKEANLREQFHDYQDSEKHFQITKCPLRSVVILKV